MLYQSRFNANLRSNYNLQLMQVTKQKSESLILNTIFYVLVFTKTEKEMKNIKVQKVSCVQSIFLQKSMVTTFLINYNFLKKKFYVLE